MQALSLGATSDMVGRDAAAITDVPPRPRHRTRQVPEAHIPSSHSGNVLWAALGCLMASGANGTT